MLIEQHVNIESIFDSEHPAARFAADCALQLEVCRSLFALADHLPGTTDREAIVYLVKALPATWAAHVAFQSEAAFPLLARRHESERHILQCLVRLDRQHIEVAGVTDEFVDQLQSLTQRRCRRCRNIGSFGAECVGASTRARRMGDGVARPTISTRAGAGGTAGLRSMVIGKSLAVRSNAAKRRGACDCLMQVNTFGCGM